MNIVQQTLVNLALNVAGSAVQALGLPTLSQFMVAMGKAFGPAGCKHWSELSDTEQWTLLTRVPTLANNHDDWPKAFQWVPRTLTTYVMAMDIAPAIIYGTGSIVDIPAPGTFVATDGYFALTTTTKLHARLGFRFDVNGRYLEFPSVTVKQLQ